jgi:hypothetical protein
MLVVAGVQHLVLDALRLRYSERSSDFSIDRCRQDRLADLLLLLDSPW